MLCLRFLPSFKPSHLRYIPNAAFSSVKAPSSFDPALFEKSSHYNYFKTNIKEPEFQNLIQKRFKMMGRAERISATIFFSNKSFENQNGWDNKDFLYFTQGEQFMAEFVEEAKYQLEVMEIADLNRVLKYIGRLETKDDIELFWTRLRELPDEINNTLALADFCSSYLMIANSVLDQTESQGLGDFCMIETIKGIRDRSKGEGWEGGETLCDLISMLFYSQSGEQQEVMEDLVSRFEAVGAVAEVSLSRMLMMAQMSLHGELRRGTVNGRD